MGQRNPTRRELLEHAFPVRLRLAEPEGGLADPVGRALRRVMGRQAHGRLGGLVYLSTLAQATSLVCACPVARLEGDWPLRLTIAFEQHQEGLMRDALRPLVGDMGYTLERAGHHRAGRPAWHLGLPSVWDGVQLMRMAHPGLVAQGSWRGRNG